MGTNRAAFMKFIVISAAWERCEYFGVRWEMFSHIFVQLFFDPAKNLSLIACRQQVALACSEYPTSRDISLSLKELITVLLSLFCPTFFLAISAKLHSAASQRECKVEIYFCSANSHTHIKVQPADGNEMK